MNKPEPRVYSLTEMGYLRRADLGAPNVQVWESPDGSLVVFPVGYESVAKKVVN